MKLCSNRPEGFGPHSTLSSPLPTSCFTDTILLPLPTWLALALLPMLLLLSLQHRKRNFDPSTKHLRAYHLHPRNCALRVMTAIYCILIVCNILMQTLEIVRLSLLHFGIGLQPFTYIGLVLGALLHATSGLNGRIRGWFLVNMTLWVGGAVMSIVQVAGLAREGTGGRKGSKYPVSDQVLDVAVMAGVYAVVAALEVLLLVWRARLLRGSERAGSELKHVPTQTVESVDFVHK